ncbi:MAG: macro domain-containing protein, partial [Verrucomicrobiota bacterium]
MLYKLIIVDRNKDKADVFRWRFRDLEEVEVVNGRFEDLNSYDCIVTAGNSFGLMDAGIDLAVVKFFGLHVQEFIQQKILSEHLGEQPVGSCLIVPTNHPSHPYVAHAPTMRVPMNIRGTDNVYQAMWATLTAIHRHNAADERKIHTRACPGLGTGTGGVEPMEASLQMLLAYRHFKNPPEFLNGSVAQDRHERIHFGGKWG